MMLKWIKEHILKLNKKKEEKRVVTIDISLEWEVYLEEFGA